MPRVSVITAYYNRGQYLERTIDSILSQTFTDFELLVLDDRSTDDSASLLAELSKKYGDQRFRYIVHPQNKGLVRGFIDGIQQLGGDYIAIQGSGDVSLPDRLAKQVELLDARPEVAAVGCWYTNIDVTTGSRRLRRPNADTTTYEQLVESNVFSHGEVMIRRSAYEAVGGYRAEFTNAQDIELWLRLVKAGWRLATVRAPLYERYALLDGVSFSANKLSRAAGYSVAARLIQDKDGVELDSALHALESGGPYTFVPKADARVQRAIRQGTVRILLMGSAVEARTLTSTAITSRFWKALLSVLVSCYASPLARPIRPLVQKVAGLAN